MIPNKDTRWRRLFGAVYAHMSLRTLPALTDKVKTLWRPPVDCALTSALSPRRQRRGHEAEKEEKEFACILIIL